MADGSSVLCKESGDITIPIKRKQGPNFKLTLKDVLIVPFLDKRLFSVESLISKENNWVQFSRDSIHSGIKSGPNIRIPITSLQSTALVVINQEKLETPDTQKKKVPEEVIHNRLHRSHGALATIRQENLWEDVEITPSPDLYILQADDNQDCVKK